jgi:hypothetical protein
VDNRNIEAAAEKREWVRPELQRLEAGSAESNFSGNPDNSAPQAS